MGAAPVSQDLERLLAVEIVSVDDGERLVDDVFGHKEGVGGTPGLDTVFRHLEGGGNLVQFLGDEVELDGFSVRSLDAAVFLLDMRLHVFLEELTDNIDHLAEAGCDGVVDGIVDDGLSVRAQAVHLFETAITAAHAGSQNK